MPRLHAVVDAPPEVHPEQARFWERALGWPVGAAWRGHPELRSFEPDAGTGYVHLQLTGSEPRVHLDLEADDPGAVTAAAVAAGARLVGWSDRWQVLRSPGGLPFCVVASAAGGIPPSVAWPDGHRSRLVQVCVDSPADRHEEEVGFWRVLLGGGWEGSASAEFAGTWHDDGASPLQLLFQRLEEPGGPVRAHLDLGTDARDAEVRRLLALGADDLGAGHGGWHVLADPAGLPFCVTGHAPDPAPRAAHG